MSSFLEKVILAKCHFFFFSKPASFITTNKLEEIPETHLQGIITKIDKIIFKSNEFVNIMFLLAQYPLNTSQRI